MLNGYASATKEMGPGSRSDLLDDVFGDQNWAKVTKLRMYLARNYDCVICTKLTIRAQRRLC